MKITAALLTLSVLAVGQAHACQLVSVPDCSTSLAAHPTFHLHEADCALFYRCEAGWRDVFACPEGQRFSLDLVACDAAASVACDRCPVPQARYTYGGGGGGGGAGGGGGGGGGGICGGGGGGGGAGGGGGGGGGCVVVTTTTTRAPTTTTRAPTTTTRATTTTIRTTTTPPTLPPGNDNPTDDPSVEETEPPTIPAGNDGEETDEPIDESEPPTEAPEEPTDPPTTTTVATTTKATTPEATTTRATTPAATTTKATTPSTTTTVSVPTLPKCPPNPTCPSWVFGDRVSKPSDCTKYYSCNFGSLQESSCQNGYQFSPKQNKCMVASKADCPMCQP